MTIIMTKLSQHFTMQEMVKSQNAIRYGINNMPTVTEQYALQAVAKHILEPVRVFGGNQPFSPSSGFRNEKVNVLAGGSENSQHRHGEAVDFELSTCSNFELANWIRYTLDFDQLILEFYTPGEPNSGWVHCSYVEPQIGRASTGKKNRRNVLTAISRPGQKPLYVNGLRT